ncbi:hypothetical protein L915_08054 [Phytophthora nicotianae]|uniref:Uncharacterized protein n=1 Tax=Phytophthora nicotianae TaxID=4792 RepID=W2GXA7_PHYNI|nr:hypothetical protein L915_08056 [Phytophthora nicotianae]ETK87516.1 hypothetical protein L915_08054 [Phytophthora nicotianae]ETL40945.1 hypothetical protein L916_07977 [Phytophthora nicotianae]
MAKLRYGLSRNSTRRSKNRDKGTICARVSIRSAGKCTRDIF